MAVNKTSPSKKRRYEEYKNSHRREKNKILKIQKHLLKHPNDTSGLEHITRLQGIIGKK